MRRSVFPKGAASAALTALFLAGCAELQPAVAPEAPPEEAPAPLPEVAVTAPPPPPSARTADAFDTTSAEQRAAAAAPPARPPSASLGTTIASLGNPAEPGFWLKTPLVTETRQGRVRVPGTDRSAEVTLIPTGGEPGSGSRMSLPAMRLLELPLTGLPEIEVLSG